MCFVQNRVFSSLFNFFLLLASLQLLSGCQTDDEFVVSSLCSSSDNVSSRVRVQFTLRISYDCTLIGRQNATCVDVDVNTLKQMAAIAGHNTHASNVSVYPDVAHKIVIANVTYNDVDYFYGCESNYASMFFLNFMSSGESFGWHFTGSYSITSLGYDSDGGSNSSVNNDGVTNFTKDKDELNYNVNGLIDLSKCKVHVPSVSDIVHQNIHVPSLTLPQKQCFIYACVLQSMSVAQVMMSGTDCDYFQNLVSAFASRGRSNFVLNILNRGCRNNSQIQNIVNFTFGLGNDGAANFYENNISDNFILNSLSNGNILMTDINVLPDNKGVEPNVVYAHNIVIYGVCSNGSYICYDTLYGHSIELNYSDFTTDYLVEITNKGKNNVFK